MKFSRTIKTNFELIDNNKILSEGYFVDDYHDIKCTLVFSLLSLEIIDTKIDKMLEIQGFDEKEIKTARDLAIKIL